MTTIYDTYYPSIQMGEIDLQNVNFSAQVVNEEYNPQSTDEISDIVGVITNLNDILMGNDISTLTMSEIIDKIKGELTEEELNKAKSFVVYDNTTKKLCFFENFDNINIDGK